MDLDNDNLLEEELEVDLEFLSVPSTTSGDKDPLEDDETEVFGTDVPPASVNRGRGHFTNKLEFQLEMDEVVAEVVQEWVQVFGRDPREYHAFYLRVLKYVEMGLEKQLLTAGKEVEALWEKYDKFALSLFGRWKRSGGKRSESSGKNKYLGPQSAYLKYILTGKVLFGDKEMDTKRRNIEKRNADVENLRRKGAEILDSLRSTRKKGTDVRNDLMARLQFLMHAKAFTFPGDVVLMNEVWIEFLDDKLKAPVEVKMEVTEGKVDAVLLNIKESSATQKFFKKSGKVVTAEQRRRKNERARLKRQQETEEEKMIRRKAERERKYRFRVSKPEAEKAEIRKRNAERKRLNYKAKSEEERSEIRKRRAEQQRLRRANIVGEVDWSEEIANRVVEGVEGILERKRDRESARRLEWIRVARKALEKTADSDLNVSRRERLTMLRKRLELEEKQVEERMKLETEGGSAEELTKLEARQKETLLQEYKFELTEKERSVLANVVKSEEVRLGPVGEEGKWKRYFDRQARQSKRSEEELAKSREKCRQYHSVRRATMTAEKKMVELEQSRKRLRNLTGEKLAKYRESVARATKKQYHKLKADPVAYKDHLASLRLQDMLRRAAETPDQRARRLMRYRVNQARNRLRLQAEGKLNVPREELEQKLEELTKLFNELPPVERKPQGRPLKIATPCLTDVEVLGTTQEPTSSTDMDTSVPVLLPPQRFTEPEPRSSTTEAVALALEVDDSVEYNDDDELTQLENRQKEMLLQEYKFELTEKEIGVLASVVKSEEVRRLGPEGEEGKWKRYFDRQARQAKRSLAELAESRRKTSERCKAWRTNRTAEERQAELERNREWRHSLKGQKLASYRESVYRAQKKRLEKLKADPVAYSDHRNKMKLAEWGKRAAETPEERARRLMGYRVNQAKNRLRLQAEGKLNAPRAELEKKLEELTTIFNALPPVAPKARGRRPRTVYSLCPTDLDGCFEDRSKELEPTGSNFNQLEQMREEQVKSLNELPPVASKLRGRCPIVTDSRCLAGLSLKVSNEVATKELEPTSSSVAYTSAPILLPPQQLSEPGVMTTEAETLVPKLDDCLQNDDHDDAPMSPSLSTHSFTEEVHEDDLCSDANPLSLPPPTNLECRDVPEDRDKSALLSTSDSPSLEFHEASRDAETAEMLSSNQEDFSKVKEEQIEISGAPQPRKPEGVGAGVDRVACDECGVTMKKASLYSHKQRNHNATYILQLNAKRQNRSWECSECDAKFASARSLWRHMGSCQNNNCLLPPSNPQTEQVIPTCSTSKEGEGDKEKFQCHLCANQYKRKDTLDDHIRRVHEGGGFFCDLCPKRGDFQSATKLWRHKVSQHDMPHLPPPPGALACEHCGEWILRSYDTHIKKCHPELIDSAVEFVVGDGSVKVKCPDCSSIVRKDCLRRHRSRHHGGAGPSYKVNCPVCAQSIDKNAFTTHIAVFHSQGPGRCDIVVSDKNLKGSVECHLCSEVTSLQYFQRHLRQVHPEAGKDEELNLTLFPCSECGLKYSGRSAVAMHFWQVHEFRHLDVLMEKMTLLRCTTGRLRRNQSACCLCEGGPSTEFDSKYEWRIHLLQKHRKEFERAKGGDSSILQFKCPLCSQNIAGMEELLQHVDGVHGGTDLKCGECGENSITMSNLDEVNRHVKRSHVTKRGKRKPKTSPSKTAKPNKAQKARQSKAKRISTSVRQRQKGKRKSTMSSSPSSSSGSDSEEVEVYDEHPPSPPRHLHNTRKRIKGTKNGVKATQNRSQKSTDPPYQCYQPPPLLPRSVSVRLVRLTDEEIQRLTGNKY